MRQKFLMRLFTAFLILGLLSWGGSSLSFIGFDFSMNSVVCAQDNELDEEAEEAGDEEEMTDEEEADDEEADEDVGDDDEMADDEEAVDDEDAEDEEAAGDGIVQNEVLPPAPVMPAEVNLRQVFNTMDSFGGYAAFWKVLAAIIVYLIWVFSLDWVSRDCYFHAYSTKKWVTLSYGCFWGGMLLFWLIPFFWVSYLFLLAGTFVPVAMFVKMHNQDLSSGEQVLTPEHLRFVFAHLMAHVGVKVSTKPRKRNDFPITLMTHGKDKSVTEPWRIQANAHPGFNGAREILSKIMTFHPEGMMLDFTANGVSSRYLLDGVWNNSEAFPRELADPALQALKILCGMKPEDRKNRQEGVFDVEFEYSYTYPEDRLKVKRAEDALQGVNIKDDRAKYHELQRELEKAKEAVRPPEKRVRKGVINFSTQGVQGGERAIFMFEQSKSPFSSMEDLGMSSEMAAALKKQLTAEKGIFVFAAPPSNGLRTTMKMALLKTDRYTREFYEIEDGIHEYEEVENVTKVPIHSKELDEWRSEMRSLFLKDPNVVIVRDIPYPEILDDMMEEIENEERFMVTTARAKDAAEALLRIMATKCDAKKWAANVNGVLCQRLVRNLCEHCKEIYQPPVETLKQIGAKERISLYRTPTPVQPKPGEKPQEPCGECHALGFSGRKAMFELVIVGDATRQALLTTPKLEAVRAALKKDGNQFMISEGMRFVREGSTSLQELKRALS